MSIFTDILPKCSDMVLNCSEIHRKPTDINSIPSTSSTKKRKSSYKPAFLHWKYGTRNGYDYERLSFKCGM